MVDHIFGDWVDRGNSRLYWCRRSRDANRLDTVRRLLGAVCGQSNYGPGPSAVIRNHILFFTDLPMASKNITLLPVA